MGNSIFRIRTVQPGRVLIAVDVVGGLEWQEDVVDFTRADTRNILNETVSIIGRIGVEGSSRRTETAVALSSVGTRVVTRGPLVAEIRAIKTGVPFLNGVERGGQAPYVYSIGCWGIRRPRTPENRNTARRFDF